MREVLISIQPKWVEKICRGEKTVEVRKNHPKCEVPFKCYIYCTMPKNKHDNLVLTPFGYDVGSESAYCNYIGNSNGKVIGEFVCDRIIDIPHKDLAENFRRLIHDIITPSCLKVEELKNYLGCKDGYGWHITDLVIYDKPRELEEFLVSGNQTYDCPPLVKLKRPPQSWCYVESEREG